jgi:hypothetical protein
MEPGYYWADHAVRGWCIVEVVKGLFGCVLEGGYAVKHSEYGELVPVAGPGAQAQIDSLIDRNNALLRQLNENVAEYDKLKALDQIIMPALGKVGDTARENLRLRAERDDLAAKLDAAYTELHDLRIKAGVR